MLLSIIPGDDNVIYVGKTEDQVRTISINIVIVIQDCYPGLKFAWNFEFRVVKNICFVFLTTDVLLIGTFEVCFWRQIQIVLNYW